MAHLQRVAFDPGRADETVEFCVRCPAAAFDRHQVRQLLTELARSPDGVFDLHGPDGRALVAVAMDVARNGADSARLELLGARGDVAADDLVRPLFAPALAYLATGPRRFVDVPAPAWLQGGRRTLEGLGFTRAYTSFAMTLAPDALSAVTEPPLPDGWRWAPLSGELTEQAYAALERIFAGDASLFLPPLDAFCARAAKDPDRWRALLVDDALAGLCAVALDGEHGDVVVIGREPSFRGRGIGRHLLAGAVTRLRARGARRITLEVLAANDRAVALYTGLGFRATSATDYYRKSVR